MALWFLRGLRSGVVTTNYPKRPDTSAVDLATPPAFDPARLTRRAALRMVTVCPSRALTVEDGGLRLDVGRCTTCGRCLDVAPEAGSPGGRFEWAARDSELLRILFPWAGPQ